MPLRPEVLKAWPPGGWQFYQPETGWTAPSPMVNGFNQQVNNIIAMRKLNVRFHLPTDFLSVARDLENYTGARIGYHHKYWFTDGDSAEKKNFTYVAPPRPPSTGGGCCGRRR